MNITLPRLYAIVDRGCFPAAEHCTSAIAHFVRELLAGSVELIQYRNKPGSSREMLSDARELRRVVTAFPLCSGRAPARLIMNDRADLCLAADFDGVHVGQDDLSPAAARVVVGDGRWVGVSTHNPEQVAEADRWPVDYIAVGPVFATMTKAKPDPVIGVEGVQRARKLTNRPLVAIGGITRINSCAVIDAGADSIAVIADLLKDPRKAAEEFLRILD